MDQLVRQKTVHLLGIATGLGLRDERTALGPDSLRNSSLKERLAVRGIQIAGFSIVRTETTRANSDFIETVRRLRDKTSAAIVHQWQEDHFFVTVGGDHSCALGTWNGVRQATAVGNMGLILIDAHLDSHTPKTSISGALHGMPLACLLCYGYSALRSSPELALRPENVCLIGARSYEPAELELLRRLEVRVFFIEEVLAHGIDSVLTAALGLLTKSTQDIGISIDLDGIDPRDAPAVSTPVANGIRAGELLRALNENRPQAGWLAAEIAEFNPAFEKNCQTTHFISDLIGVLAG